MNSQSYKVLLKSIGMETIANFKYLQGNSEMIVGRSNNQEKIDFPIFNKLVSRRHCKIYLQNGLIFIEDLQSKHGTELNGQKLTPFKSYQFKEGDSLTLISGLIEFQIEKNNDDTIEFYVGERTNTGKTVLNDSMQTLQIKKELIKMAHKEFTCFKLLFNHIGNIATKEEIIQTVWPERNIASDSLVTDEEISSLIYRVRKKVGHHYTIKSIKNKGYYLEEMV
ncbi:FHA domain-containing protein [Peribacillus huizhouensis]|uniref:DNA-binding winged helix-turn-helix (WHTH) protein n=1 Tax=Peribacillus huizhouensis TaxID=1501239 RepID=A0ABR6CR05_9BACI|nr:FHA domain-containing protein [Peribacillus huizhouensis]MBA9026772.1 DNA-binding winged helix-turn-helix (wHTH) protein [Peribacillus huizhouensis]